MVRQGSGMSSKISQVLCLLIITCLTSLPVSARGVYQTKADFLALAFDNTVPSSQTIWLKGSVKTTLQDILGHRYQGLRVRYWQKEQRTAWVLEEIGKEQPITFGVIVHAGKIEKITVLAFRESRGWEIRYPAFTQQFVGARLNSLTLDRPIDGISGATLSVWAMTGVARVALYLASLT